MNTERLEALAAKIEALPHVDFVLEAEGFNMAVWREEDACGTACCIGGWACAMAHQEDTSHPLMSELAANRWLGLDGGTGDALYYPKTEELYRDIKPARAAAVIRHLIKTGEVDWSVKAA